MQGAAIECRLYAENPAKNFLPSPGTITTWQAPSGEGVRVDSGIHAGSQVTPYYDPLLAKIVTYGLDRAQTIDRMRQALDSCRVEGVRSNLALLQQVMDNARFQAGELSTQFLSQMV